jgi:small subunit ribosomal protein S6
MRKYETVLVLNPDLSEADLKEELKKIEGQLQTNEAQSIKTDRWGKKELGFRMRKRTTGHYVCMTFESENSALIDVATSLLRINDNVLKFQTHRINEKVRKFRGNPRRTGSSMDDGSDSDFVVA